MVAIASDSDGPSLPKKRKSDDSKKKDPVFTRADAQKLVDLYVKDKVCKLCQDPLNDDPQKQPHNIKRHFEKKHKQLLDAYFKKREEDKLSILNSALQGQTVTNEDPIQCFMMYVATTTFPRSHLNNKYLKRCFELLDCQLPSPYKMSKMIDEQVYTIHARILNLVGTRSFSISVDESTSKSKSMKCLCAIVHFVNEESKKIDSAVMPLKQLNDRATKDNIRDSIEEMIVEFGLEPGNVVRTVTDGAANMTFAFIDPFPSNSTDLDENLDASFEDVERMQFETEQDRNEYVDKLMADFEKEDALVADSNKDELIDPEKKFNVWCLCHRIQLTVGGLIKDSEFKELHKRVFATLKGFAKSENACRELRDRTNKVILFPASTRWMATRITYERAVEIVDDINLVAIKHKWPAISSEDKEQMQSFVDLLEPLNDALLVWESDGLTLSSVYSGIRSLIEYYDDLGLKNNNAKKLSDIIKRRFSDVINLKDSIYLTAALLDPREASYVLGNNDTPALDSIRKMAAQFSINSQVCEVPSSSGGTSAFSKFGWNKKSTTSESEVPKIDKLHDEWHRYVLEYPTYTTCNPVEFWLQREQSYPMLSQIALKVFTVPASTSSAERVFSQFTLATENRKGCSKVELVSQKISMIYNHKFVL